MAAPTQQLPPWLSVSTSIATDASGNPTATATTLLQLPLTYYGPSIPLGTDGAWVYGGLTSPASSASTPTATSPSISSISTTSAIPSSISTILSSTSTPLSTSQSPSFSSSTSLPTTFSLSPSASASPVSSAGSSSHRRKIIGAVLGSVLGSLFLLLLLILFLRWRSRGSRGTGALRASHTGGSTDNPLWMWEVVDEHQAETGPRPPGTGSPRGSGEEGESFLRRSGGATDGMKEVEPSARLVGPSRVSGEGSGPIGIALAGARTNANADEKSPPLGSTLLAHADNANATSDAPSPTRHIIRRSVLVRMYADAPQSPDGGEEHEAGVNSPLLPPRPLDPDALGKGRPQSSTSLVSRSSRKPSNVSIRSEGSVTPGNDPEQAVVQTARRVRLDAHRGSTTLSTVNDESPRAMSPASRWARDIGDAAVRSLGIPAFKYLRSPRSGSSQIDPRSRPPSFATRELTDAELEMARAAEMGYRDGSRPISTVSGRSAGSANTVFYDANSRTSSPIPPVPPLPTGTGSSGGRGTSGLSPLSSSYMAEPERSESSPPAYEPSPQSSPREKDPDALDLLDLPVPRPASPFATASSSMTRTGAQRPPVPPGLTLTLPDPQAWRDSGSGESPFSMGSSADVTIDILEEAPPAAGAGWSIMSRSTAADPGHEKRTTFGTPQVVGPSHDHVPSETASLHSMHSHLRPPTALSISGSAPASSCSGSSRPSGHSQGRTASSGASLGYSASISSDGRRRPRHPAGEISPPISAVGRSSMIPQLPPYSPQSTSLFPVGPVPSATVNSMGTTGTGETSSSITTHTSITDHVTGEIMRFPSPPWTAGIDPPREGDDASSGGWGGSWNRPNHLSAVLQSRVTDQDSTSHT